MKINGKEHAGYNSNIRDWLKRKVSFANFVAGPPPAYRSRALRARAFIGNYKAGTRFVSFSQTLSHMDRTVPFNHQDFSNSVRVVSRPWPMCES